MEIDFDRVEKVDDFVTVPTGTYLCKIAEVRGLAEGTDAISPSTFAEFTCEDDYRAVAEEVREAGVTVTAHCPGATLTNFGDTAGNAKSILFKVGAAPADKVARHAYRSMMKGKVVAIEGLMNWLAAFSVRFSPRAWVRKITRWLHQTS